MWSSATDRVLSLSHCQFQFRSQLMTTNGQEAKSGISKAFLTNPTSNSFAHILSNQLNLTLQKTILAIHRLDSESETKALQLAACI